MWLESRHTWGRDSESTASEAVRAAIFDTPPTPYWEEGAVVSEATTVGRICTPCGPLNNH